jgi:hypothetical protein
VTQGLRQPVFFVVRRDDDGERVQRSIILVARALIFC